MQKNQSGFSLIELLIVILVTSIIAAIAIPNLMAARRNANEASTVSSLRTITSAEVSYRSSIGSGNFATMADLISGGLLDVGFASGSRNGYNYTLNKVDESAGQPPIFNASAIPIKFGTNGAATGSRSYYVNESGVIYVNYTAAAPFATDNLDRTINNGLPLNN